MPTRAKAKKRSTGGGHAKRRLIDAMPDVTLMSDVDLLHEANAIAAADERSRRRWYCPRPECDGDPHRGWLHRHARDKQHPPAWAWRTWMILTGRGWGKTRSAAELVREWAQKPNQLIAVVAKKELLVREICFESPKAGLLSVIPPEEVVYYHSGAGDVEMLLKNGTLIRGFGAEVPDNFRGWAFDKVWADEYAAWNRHTAQAAMDMLWFCLREAAEPQVVISTTPKALPHIKKLVKRSANQSERIADLKAKGEPHDEGPKVALTAGHTNENKDNLTDDWMEEITDQVGGTRLGQQELAGVVLQDVEGALWKTWMFDWEGFRVDRGAVPILERKVIAVDVAVTSTETADESGIAVMGRTGWRDLSYADPRPRGYLLRSRTMKATPLQTMTEVAKMYHAEKCDVVVLEANNGGEYLSTVLMMVDPTVQWRLVNATRDKRARATPVASLYEQTRMHHAGPPKDYDALETTMTSYTGSPESEEKSPDDMDALVWAAWDLFLDPTTVAARPPKDRRSEGRR